MMFKTETLPVSILSIKKVYFMQQEFLNLSPDIWRVIFDIIRYVVVALILAYVTNVLVKRKNIRTDIKGRVLE